MYDAILNEFSTCTIQPLNQPEEYLSPSSAFRCFPCLNWNKSHIGCFKHLFDKSQHILSMCWFLSNKCLKHPTNSCVYQDKLIHIITSLRIIIYHYNDITWVLRPVKYLATWLLVQQHDQANNKENIKTALPELVRWIHRSLPGPRLNIKTVLSTYGDFHVKDKTAVRTSYL